MLHKFLTRFAKYADQAVIYLKMAEENKKKPNPKFQVKMKVRGCANIVQGYSMQVGEWSFCKRW